MNFFETPYTQLKANNDMELLSPFLEHEDRQYVSLWAASYSLVVNAYLAISVLEALANEKGLIGITAKTTLKEWEKGNLNCNAIN